MACWNFASSTYLLNSYLVFCCSVIAKDGRGHVARIGGVSFFLFSWFPLRERQSSGWDVLTLWALNAELGGDNVLIQWWWI